MERRMREEREGQWACQGGPSAGPLGAYPHCLPLFPEDLSALHGICLFCFGWFEEFLLLTTEKSLMKTWRHE